MAFQKVDRQHLVNDLKHNVVEIIFDHPDPNEGRRVVVGTLQPSWFPENSEFRRHGKIDETVSSIDMNHVPILDIKTNRFFRMPIDRIISCQTVNY